MSLTNKSNNRGISSPVNKYISLKKGKIVHWNKETSKEEELSSIGGMIVEQDVFFLEGFYNPTGRYYRTRKYRYGCNDELTLASRSKSPDGRTSVHLLRKGTYNSKEDFAEVKKLFGKRIDKRCLYFFHPSHGLCELELKPNEIIALRNAAKNGKTSGHDGQKGGEWKFDQYDLSGVMFKLTGFQDKTVMNTEYKSPLFSLTSYDEATASPGIIELMEASVEADKLLQQYLDQNNEDTPQDKGDATSETLTNNTNNADNEEQPMFDDSPSDAGDDLPF